VAKQEETWQQREARERLEAMAALKVACAALRRLGVETVEARYDGAGDSGWIQEIRYAPEPPAGIPEGLPQVIERFVYTRLPDGWEIETGSEGTLAIDVSTAREQLTHRWKHGESFSDDYVEEFDELDFEDEEGD
jgi:hypothetical protein